MPKARARRVKRAMRPSTHANRAKPAAHLEIERGLKTRILSLLMLILASSLGFWFFGFEPWALAMWVIVALAGGYVIFEYDLFVSKAMVVLAAFAMQYLVLEGAQNLLVLGSPTNLMMLTFAVLDLVLIYALSRL
ncbi:Uncharacterised protein [uncultured archaeon]|nr:Uncharacterised protein [uncultured archaeon]